MKIPLFVLTAVILAVAPQIRADTFQVTYVPTSGESCSISCISTPPAFLTPFQATFSLADDTLPDGTYDVSSSYSLAFANQPPPPLAAATVVGGEVTDLTVAYSATFTVPFASGLGSKSFNASLGIFSDSTSTPLSCGNGCNIFTTVTEHGTYTITEITETPEPSSAILLAMGLLGLGFILRKSI
jgi:hypothetical protein